VPGLDRALKAVERAAPTLADEIESQLLRSRVTKGGFCVEALAAAAIDLGRQPRFTVKMVHGHRIVLPVDKGDLFDRIDQVARAAVRHWGVATIEDIAAAAGTTVSATQKFLPLSNGFKWLDAASGWFWIENLPRNSLLTQIRKILAVSPSIDVGELRTGVGRHHRRKGFAPPRRVLLELCRQLSWSSVDGETVKAAVPLNPADVLSDAEQIIFRVLNQHGPVVERPRFEKLCLSSGINNKTFSVLLSYCPLICRHATGVYGLRGAQVPVGLVESLIPKRSRKSKLLVDYGWTGDRNVQALYRVSAGILNNGVLSIPAALKAFLQGTFRLMTGDDCRVGTLVVRENSAWGLGPFFTRRGGEPGDYLSIVFNLNHRIAVVEIGDASFTDKLGDPANSFLDSRSLIRSGSCTQITLPFSG